MLILVVLWSLMVRLLWQFINKFGKPPNYCNNYHFLSYLNLKVDKDKMSYFGKHVKDVRSGNENWKMMKEGVTYIQRKRKTLLNSASEQKLKYYYYLYFFGRVFHDWNFLL